MKRTQYMHSNLTEKHLPIFAGQEGKGNGGQGQEDGRRGWEEGQGCCQSAEGGRHSSEQVQI